MGLYQHLNAPLRVVRCIRKARYMSQVQHIKHSVNRVSKRRHDASCLRWRFAPSRSSWQRCQRRPPRGRRSSGGP